MFEYLPPGLRAELESARMDAMRRKSRLRVRIGDTIYPILRFRSGWFTLDVSQVDHLRGVVDIYDGGRHLFECLICASEVEGEELICRVKQSTFATGNPPVDFARDENAPVALLPRD
jgi:hypothetical protein